LNQGELKAPETTVETEQAEAARFRIGGMDCAACAATVEKVVGNLDGVDSASVSIGNATMVVEGPATAETIQAAVRRAGYTAQPASQPRGDMAPFWRRSPRTFSTTLAIGLLFAAVITSLTDLPATFSETLFLLTMITGGWAIAVSALAAVRQRALDMNVLMALAAVGAVAIGDYAEAAWVVVLFAVGNALEDIALERSRRSVESLRELAPTTANVLFGSTEILTPVEEIVVGSSIVIRPGERLPLDGEVIEGNSSVDESTLTGESLPVDKRAGEDVFAGTLNVAGSFTMRTTSGADDSTLAQVTRLVSDAQGSRAPSERFVDRFARIYTPIVLVVAVAVAVVPVLAGGSFDTWIYRALALLIVACPCALVISVPASVVAAIGGAAKIGVLIKGGQVLEDLASTKAVALDKTGTLTRARPVVVTVVTFDRIEDDAALGMMAAIEKGSEHPLGQALVRAATDIESPIPSATGFEAIPGKGAEATVGGRALWAGGPRMAAGRKAQLPPEFEEIQTRGETAVILGEGDRVLAIFGLADEPRVEAAEAVSKLRCGQRIDDVVMLTGDSEPVARTVADRTGITAWRSGLLPEEKLDVIRELEDKHGPTVMVGDGVNDAPALAGATVGVAMGAAGSDVALDSADVALMGDDLVRLADAIRLSRKAVNVMKQNVTVSLVSKALFVVLAPLGYVTLVTAIAVDMGISLLVTMNGLRLLRRPRTDSHPRSETTIANPTEDLPATVVCCEDEDCKERSVPKANTPQALPMYTGDRES
jgi:Cd2+/Zn2+-exporting ATPase